MSNETVQSGLTALASTAIAEARHALSNMDDLTRVVRRQILRPGQISAVFPKFGALTAAALTDGNAASNQQFTATGVTLTPAVNSVARATITDLADFSSNLQLQADFGRAAAHAIVKKRNADIWALFAGFTQSVGTTNTDLTEAALRKARRMIEESGAGGPIYLAVSPRVVEDLLGLYSTNTNQTADVLRAMSLTEGKLPSIYGVTPLVINGVSEDGSGDYICGMFASDAIGYAESWDIRIEVQRVAASVGFEIVASSAYAVGEIEDLKGVKVIADGD